MATNNFLPFCPTDSGTNLLSQVDYAAATNRDIGNQPGVASSKLNNKAIRQSAFITSQIAQFIADKTGSNVLDDADTDKLLGQMNAALLPLSPSITKYITGSGSHNMTYKFFIDSGNATAAATYTNNAVTFTVKTTVASGTQVEMTGGGSPAVSGTLTKTGGAGDATLTFYAVRVPIYYKLKVVGAGGGGGPSGSSNVADGGSGGSTTFSVSGGSAILTATGGGGGLRSANQGGVGGTFTINSPAVGVGCIGGSGGGGFYHGTATTEISNGSSGAGSFFGGAGGGGAAQAAGAAGAANTGGGGGGGGSEATAGNYGGCGGGSGAFIDAIISSPSAVYDYAIGAGGSAGVAAADGHGGGLGGSGLIIIEEHYQ
jgi:hypothetical protein